MGSTPKAGEKLGRFQIEKKIGQGGMGIVYLAHDPLLNIRVAVKLLNPTLFQEGRIERFQREVLLARRIAHPGICRLYDIHQEGEHLFVTMEYVAGPTLKDLVQAKGIPPIVQTVELARAICRALEAAHNIGVIHRDLKPNNVVVRGRGRISILDFGLATALDMRSITAAGMHVGTYHYMPPEVIKGQPASSKSDLYSLGVILYECVTGRLPYQGQDIVDLGRAIQSGDVVPPRQFNPDMPEALERLILKTMSMDPAARYADMDELHDALGVVLEALPDLPEDEAIPGPPVPTYSDETRTPEAASPWHGDIDKSVEAAIADPNYSQIIQTRMRDSTILFSDILGITSFFDKHGDVAGFKKIQRHNELLFPVVERHRGKVVKTIGDAIMASFTSADEGVGAAIGMQRALARYNQAAEKEEDKLYIRIGLNSGRSIFEREDVFGDTVNVAARVSSMAEGDQILISAETRALLGPGLEFTRFHKSVALKGKSGSSDLYSVHWSLEETAPDQEMTTETMEAPKIEAAMEAWEVAVPPRRSRRGILALGGGLAAGAVFAAILFATTGGDGKDEAVDAGRPSQAAVVAPMPDPEPALPTRVPDAGLDPTPGPPDIAPGTDIPEDEPDAGTPELVRPALPPDAGTVASHVEHLTIAKRREFEGLRRSFYAASRRKGIIRGDHRDLDRAKKRMENLRKKKMYAEAIPVVRQARSALDRIRVDAVFVKAKADRFNRAYDNIKSNKLAQAVAPLVQEYFTAHGAGNYRKANQLLNRAFKLVRGR